MDPPGIDFDLFFQSNPNPMWFYERGTLRFLAVNDAAVLQYGYSPAEFLGMTLRDIRPPEDVAIMEANAAAATAPMRVDPRPWRHLRKDGSLLLADVHAHSCTFQGREAVLILSLDVTEVWEMRQRLLQADRMASVGVLAAGVAHEINNPLSYLISSLVFLGDQLHEGLRAVTPQQLAELRQALADARVGAERVRHVVGGLRTFSRTGDERRERVELPPVLDLSTRMAGREISSRARLVTRYDPTPAVVADEGNLGQVFLNLLVNAAHAIPEGDPEQHEVRVATWTDELGRAVIEVSDTGVGIPGHLLPRVFEPFFTTKPIGVGTGLGLSICRNLVTAAGGEISVADRPGRGTTFRVSLPPAPPPR